MSNLVIKGNASGAGTVTVESPNTNSDRTITLPDSAGQIMVTGNMPAFSAYGSSAQTVSSGTFTKVTLGAELFDTNNNFASSTFTPTVAGYYQINCTFWFLGLPTTRGIGSLYKNGSILCRFVDIDSSKNEIAANGSEIVYMNGTTDYLEMYIWMQGSGTLTTSSSISSETCRFSGSLVRSA